MKIEGERKSIYCGVTSCQKGEKAYRLLKQKIGNDVSYQVSIITGFFVLKIIQRLERGIIQGK